MAMHYFKNCKIFYFFFIFTFNFICFIFLSLLFVAQKKKKKKRENSRNQIFMHTSFILSADSISMEYACFNTLPSLTKANKNFIS